MQNQLINITKFVFLLIMISPILTFGQKSIDKNFNWDDSDDTQTLYIQVKKGVDKLTMDFDGRISEGSFLMTAYDPEGNKVGGFSLVCSGGGDNVNVHVDISGDGNSETHVHTDGHSHTHVNTNSGANTATSSSTTTTTTTTTTSDDESSEKSKTKLKNKSKRKKAKLYSHIDTDTKGSKGVMKKVISDPTPGKWKFVLETKAVTGRMSAEVEQD